MVATRSSNRMILPNCRPCRRLLLAPAALLFAACTSSVEPPDRVGEWLVDLDSVYCSALPVVSFSADRDWMLFWTRHSHADRDTGRRTPITSPALLELDGRRLVLPAGPAERAEGPSFSPSSACWDDAGKGIFVRASSLQRDAERPWYRAGIGPDAELVRASAPPESCRQPSEVEWQSHRDAVIPADVRGGLEVVRDGCCAVELRAADGSVLVRHEARSAQSDYVSVGMYAWSESRTRLAYTVHEETSWRFARPTRSFVVDKSGQPELLGGQTYAFAWRGDEELIACADRPRAEGGGSSLKRWRF
ncbi:MAG: hypothetical protein EA419_08050 [Wenzhouxiangella sp.]|nr:MAG: hypothetical protein EA419_08050 [Wenzhouxiangella sp.]